MQVTHIDNAIALSAPNLKRGRRNVTQWRPSVHFVTGELTRRYRTAPQEAQGGAIITDEIAVDAQPAAGP